MKSYEETINSVFDRIRKYEVKKKRRRKAVMRGVTSLCCFCLVALLGMGVWQSGLIKSNPFAVLDGKSSGPQGTDKTDNTNSANKDLTDNRPDGTIIWGTTNEAAQDDGFIEWNGKTVTYSLYDVLCEENNKNSLIAVSASFAFDDLFMYNGKPLAEYALEADNERLLISKLGELIKIGDSLKYGDALYKTGTPTGEKWSKEFYDETVEYYGKELLAKYIVNGEFLKEKLVADISEYNQHQPCRIAYEEAYDAYYQSAVDAAAKQLKKQNINYEVRNGKELVIYVTGDELASLSIDNIMVFGLALKDGEAMDEMEVIID